MDTQPGQVPTSNDNNQTPEAVQQPGSGATQGSPAGQNSTDPILPAVPGQQPASEENASFYSPNETGAPAETQPAENWQYSKEADPTVPQTAALEDVTWTASEFIEHSKGIGWYGLLTLVGLVVAGLNYFFTKDIVSTVLLGFAVLIFGIYAGHKPREQQYHLSPQGLQIGGKLYAFQTFKAFSVAEESSIASIMFTPLGRFAPPVTIYVAQDMEEKVLTYISNFLPLEQRRADAVDGLLRKIRF